MGLLLKMVTTRSQALVQEKQQRQLPLKKRSIPIVEYESEDSLSEYDSDTNSDMSMDTNFDNDNQQHQPKRKDQFLSRNEMLLFDDALEQTSNRRNSVHWTETKMYNYMYNKFIKHIFTFGEKQHYTPGEWSDYFAEMVRTCHQEDYKHLCSVKEQSKRVGICSFRNEPRTLSKVVFLNGYDYYTGPRCAEMLTSMTKWFVMVENEITKYQKDYSLMNRLLNKLENILVDFETP